MTRSSQEAKQGGPDEETAGHDRDPPLPVAAQGEKPDHSTDQMEEGQSHEEVVRGHPKPDQSQQGQRNAYEEAEGRSECPADCSENDDITQQEQAVDQGVREEKFSELFRHVGLILPQAVDRMAAMLELNRTALKEWAAIQRSLARGQILLIRKGGILEQKQRFTVEHREFFLFPTYAHQNENDLVPAAHRDLAASFRGSPPADQVCFDFYAVAEEVWKVDRLDSLQQLEGQHILSWSAVEARFRYRRPGVHVLALRVFQLPETIRRPNQKRYDGCVSWVELEEPLPTVSARPVLSGEDFRAKLESVRGALASAVPI